MGMLTSCNYKATIPNLKKYVGLPVAKYVLVVLMAG
jgi:hypothetical protein